MVLSLRGNLRRFGNWVGEIGAWHSRRCIASNGDSNMGSLSSAEPTESSSCMSSSAVIKK
jgi:hypothetical protein